MSKYTIELRLLLEYPLFDIGLQDYSVPAYVTGDAAIAWRRALNKKIVDHYYMDEICCKQPDLFKHFINTKMREIMPYYCKLYEAANEHFSFDAGSEYSDTVSESVFENKTGTTTNERSNSSTTVNEGEESNYTLGVASDTPAQMLNIENDIANNTYASSASKNKGSSTTSDSTSISGSNSENGNTSETNTVTRTRTRTVSGISGKSKAELYAKYVESLQNIDMLVINDLRECFMAVY